MLGKLTGSWGGLLGGAFGQSLQGHAGDSYRGFSGIARWDTPGSPNQEERGGDSDTGCDCLAPRQPGPREQSNPKG